MVLPPNIVIVEDEVITQRYLQDILSQYEVKVTACFDNAKETLAGLKNVPCDMLLMDINIKGPMDGIQLAREILRTSTLPIIFITAHNDDETLEELLELAPYGFIGKPFSSKDVLVVLQIGYKRYLTQNKEKDANNIKEIPFDDIMIGKKYRYSQKLHILYDGKNRISLNKKQAMLLRILVENINHVVPNDILVGRIWENTDIADSALRTLVYSFRKILPDFPIVSRSKMGYMLETE